MFKSITCDYAKSLMRDASFLIADVRDWDSYQKGHIEGAVHLSIPSLKDFCGKSHKNQPILVYCYHGISSQSVAQHLVDQGFSHVYSLIGGFEAWKNDSK